MIRLDKIKIISAESAIVITDVDSFTESKSKGKVKSYTYESEMPQVEIKVDKIRGELVLEFTGKILGERYTELINKQNIRQCLENINELGICRLDVDTILKEGKVCKADITKDVKADFNGIVEDINGCIKSNQKYNLRKIDKNFIIEKNVVSRRNRLRMTVYDKEEEMGLSKNITYFKRFKNYEDIMLYFKDKVRFEMNVYSMEQLRNVLNINGDTDLTKVLSADGNPIYAFFDKVLVDDVICSEGLSLKEEQRLSFIEKYGGADMDMKKVENAVRNRISDKSNFQRAIQPFRAVWSKCSGRRMNVKSKIKNMLLEIFICTVLFDSCLFWVI